MASTVKEILTCLDSAYPFTWAVPEDRVGLQVGYLDASVNRVLVALEASLAVVAEAQAYGAELLITHHPLLYRPMGEVLEDQPGGRLLAAVVRAGLSVAACHTNLDVAPGGLNQYLAERLGLTEVQVLSEVSRESWCKVTVFVPVGYEDRVRQALFDERAGVIGNYSHCSFAGRGQGTYLPLEGAHPFRGEVASLSRAEESRLEVLVPERNLGSAVMRMKAAHPYEEVAYDLYPLKNPGAPLGFGRLGRWPKPMTFPAVLSRIKETFHVDTVGVWGQAPTEIERVAVLGGSGGDLIARAQQQGAQLYVTGEVRHHQAIPGFLENFAIVEVGHFASEVVFMPPWAAQLERLFQDKGVTVTVQASETEKMPLAYF